MPTHKRTFFVASIFSIIILLFSISFAADDGFQGAKKTEGRFFTVYFADGLDVAGLVQQLNITTSDQLIAGKPVYKMDSQEVNLSESFDILYLVVCDILDMELYDFKSNIKICRDSAQLNDIYKRLFKQEITETHSFYANALNTIYVTAQDVKRDIMGYQMGLAVISHYFVVLPSDKIKDVLARYVATQLQKPGSQQ